MSVDRGEPRPGEPKFVTKLRAQKDRHRERPKVLRIVFVVMGFTVLLLGVVMLVTPGPAFVLIPIGLAMLALEFAWAENLLEKAVEQGEVAKQKAANASRTQKILSVVATILGIAAAVAAVLLWDIPLLPDK